MIGILEIIFSIIVFCVIWFVIFKLKIYYNEKTIRKDIENKIDNQKNKEFFIDGKKVKINKKTVKEIEPPKNTIERSIENINKTKPIK